MAPQSRVHNAQDSHAPVKKRGFRLPGQNKRRQLEEELSHVNQQIYRRNLELNQTNKMLALLEAIDKLVLESDAALRPLCTQLAQKVVQETDYPFVAIMAYDDGIKNEVHMFGWATGELVKKPQRDLMDSLTLNTEAQWFKDQELIKFIDLAEVPDEYIAEQLAVERMCCVKLRVRQKLVGIMLIGTVYMSFGPDAFTHSLLTRLSEATGIAIDHKMLLEENQRVLDELEESNSKLRVLDHAKDEFISMASHQLRTPLTSVKGYISMVLDGDAGQVSEAQGKLLNEAFTASQRMVYLIGDFLNVSRLQTGKFVIDAKPTQLTDVISEEIAQLRSTAARRNITILYLPPADFPVLKLDDNKIRQVIMNFVDNAIFYSKPDSEVRVVLIKTDKEIRFEVHDKGIGVPEAERHKLFAKFYRAENARRVRPDGTGIGLFMAKKVIVAHGGSLIFESEENVGSTFGFSLPLSLKDEIEKLEN
jgi:signal transduction histidine kinase